MNVCPVYERTGGHAYGSVYPGPIGAILTPLLTGIGATTPSLPYASTLCGACYDACPVQINIPESWSTSEPRPSRAGTPGPLRSAPARRRSCASHDSA